MRTRPEFPYTRLAGTLRGFIGKASLWEGTDHLLSVTGTRFSEDYRRFYYRDIEAILVQKCMRSGSIGLWIVCIFACIITSSIAIRSSNKIAWPIACVFILLVLYRLVVSILYSCRCYIQTAVSREELPSLQRTWTAQKTLGRLRINIAEAQGMLPENIAELREAAGAVNATPEPVEANTANANRQEESASLGFNLAIATFILLLVDAAISLWFLNAPSRVLNSIWLRSFSIGLILAEGAAAVLALLKLSKFRHLRPLRYVLFATLAFLAVEIWFSLYFREIYTQITALGAATAFDRVSHWVQLISGNLAILLGAGGLLLVLLKWQTYRRGNLSTA